ncbi:LysR substrate-binding domain-containing protein [Aquitalea palustris]|uniref:LysR substrate-binding domain-containing protein n=1 Tax=Aquitalea palustris TaxID=2480983 RepID=UPI001314CB85|nr:LysR substrate-binding domain-containing protein [Aquitalea palustris]
MSGISTNFEQGDAKDAYPLAILTRPLPSMMGLQAFVAVASLGSLTRAARQLCRTQGAVSRQIQQLEQFYQQVLFHRTPSGMSMTPYAERLYAVASKTLGDLSSFSCDSQLQPDRIRLRLPSTFALRWFLPRLYVIQQCLSGILLEISTKVIDRPEFGSGDFDAMIARGNGQWEGLRSAQLFPEQLTPMCRAELSLDLQVPADMAHYRLIHANGSQQEWQSWWQTYAAAPMPGQHLFFDSLDAAVNAATQGYGIALADPRLFQDQLSQGTLVMPFPQWHSGEYGYYLVTPASSANLPKLDLLAKTLHSLV